MMNSANDTTTENLTDKQELEKYKYLVYGGYINPALVKKINISIRKFLRYIIKTSGNNEFNSELRAVNDRLVKEIGVIEHLSELGLLLKKIAEFAPQTLKDLAILILTIVKDLSMPMNDPRVLDAIENKLPID